MSKVITSMECITPELRLQMLKAINITHYVAECIQTREQAVAFNEAISAPLRKIQRFHGLPSGNVVKLKAKVA